MIETARGWCDLRLPGWGWENDGRDLALDVIAPSGKRHQVHFDWAHQVIIDLHFPQKHGGMPLTWGAEIVALGDSTINVRIDFGSTGEIRLMCNDVRWRDAD